jgi:beta-1,4-mannooligosaccharide/beta-1,4-mannosyl-N-acetylglucosamine phosphorylase
MQPAGWWQSTKVGAGPSPIETKDGWLLIYHGVRTTCSGMVYCAGTALLDLERPWKVLHRSKRYLMAPTELYETTGDVPNVVFPNAAVVDPKTRNMKIYYGGADTVVALAHGNLDDLVAFTKRNG